MNNTKELNELIYAGAKFVCTKIGASLKITNRNSNAGWEIRLETQIRNIRWQAKMPRERKNAEPCRDDKRKAAYQAKQQYNSRK